MAKSMLPTMKAGSGAGKKLLGVVTLLALLVLVIRNPVEAATWFKQGAALVGNLADALGLFFGAVLG